MQTNKKAKEALERHFPISQALTFSELNHKCEEILTKIKGEDTFMVFSASQDLSGMNGSIIRGFFLDLEKVRSNEFTTYIVKGYDRLNLFLRQGKQMLKV
jgi:hypothetical protein